MTLRTHLIQTTSLRSTRSKPDIVTACGRMGWHLASHTYIGHTGRTLFNAVTVDQQTAVPWVDCRECLKAIGHPQEGLSPREADDFRLWAHTQPEFTSLDPLTGIRLRERWEKEGRP